jgi:hypothetical protein
MNKIIRKRKALIVLTAVIAVVALIDVLFGCLINAFLSNHHLPGDYTKIEYLLKNSDEEMIIIGSSTAINAYIPQMIEDSLGITCFNGGCNSQNMPFFQSMVEGVLNRYTPKYIVLSMRRNELATNYKGRLNLLNPYYHKGYKSIDYFLEEENGWKTILLKSNLYRYNTIFWRILLYYVKPDNELKYKGFSSHDVPKIPPVLRDESNYTSRYKTLNPENLNCFLNIIRLCQQKGVQLIVALPPDYILLPDRGHPYELTAIENLCSDYHIPVLNDCQSPFFLSHPELFYDELHLNYAGSKIYTRQFIRYFLVKK